MSTPIDVWLLTGYLGAGKTTMLNNLLGAEMFKGKRVALVINEFGQLGIDGALVRPGEWTKFELNKGSLFCACIKVDTVKVLRQIAFDIKPDVVIIEATGLSESADLEALFASSAIEDLLNVRANICLVDPVTFTKVCAFVPCVTRQVQQADGIVINKCDLSDEASLKTLTATLTQINPRAAITMTSFADIPNDWLAGLTHASGQCGISSGPPAQAVSVSIQSAKPINQRKFMAALSELKGSILRLKGNIDFGDGSIMVEYAGGELTQGEAIKNLRPPTAFVVIAWGVNRDELAEKLSRP